MKLRAVWRGVFASVLLCYAMLTTALTLSSRPKLLENVNFSAAVSGKAGHLLRLTLTSDEKYRLWMPLNAISEKVIQATLTQEDQYFYFHFGVNPVALLRAFYTTEVASGPTVGASTITMQLARLLGHLQTRSIKGKLWQIWQALRLEWYYPKDRILEAYLNLAPYGGNIEGAGAASEIYFNKAAGDLTLTEALLLSVMPQSPSLRSPRRDAGTSPSDLTVENKRLTAARGRLLQRWDAKHGRVDASVNELSYRRRFLRRREQLPFRAPHFVDSLMSDFPLRGRIVTTLNLDLQTILERRIKAYVERKSHLGIRNASAMLIDFRNMEVQAVVGSANFFDASIQGQVNGTRARRSPGSTLKPFIYGLALDQGLLQPMTMLKDAPTTFGDWQPENFDREFAGPIRAKDALIRSRNVPAIQVAAGLKNPTLYEFLKAVGIDGLRDEDFYGLALVLGGAEVTMQDLVRMYAMLGNGGMLKPLRRLANDPVARGKRLLSPEAARIVLDMLKDNPRPVRGYEKQWTVDQTPVQWKTGTSYSFRDAWTVGVFGPYVLAVWLGNFDGESNPALIGLEAAAPLFFEIVDAIKAYHGGSLPPVPVAQLPKIKEVSVCAVSGKLPGPYCRRTVKAEYIPGKSPIQICDIHRPVQIDDATGLRACRAAANQHTHMEIFEFWPSDLLRIFRQAGIPRRAPPAWESGCSLQVKHGQGHAPAIVSPKASTIYNTRLSAREQEFVPFEAVTDADTREVFWFVNNVYLGVSSPMHPYFWRLKPGEFEVKAVDDLGRAGTRHLRVDVVE